MNTIVFLAAVFVFSNLVSHVMADAIGFARFEKETLFAWARVSRPMQFVTLTVLGTIATAELRSFGALILARLVSSDSGTKHVELVPDCNLLAMSAATSAAVMIALWQLESEGECE